MITHKEIELLDPGVRGLVVWLNQCGFKTCDSGDGKSKFVDRPINPEAELDYPHVFIAVESDKLIKESDRLFISLARAGLIIMCPTPHDAGKPLPHIVARYEPGDSVSFIELNNVLTDMVSDLRGT